MRWIQFCCSSTQRISWIPIVYSLWHSIKDFLQYDLRLYFQLLFTCFSDTTTTYHSAKILFMALSFCYFLYLDCPSTCTLLSICSANSSVFACPVHIVPLCNAFNDILTLHSARQNCPFMFFNFTSQSMIHAPVVLASSCDSCAHNVKIETLIL